MCMEDLCSKTVDDDPMFVDKVHLFVRDRSIDAVTGIRRMGRENMVRFTAKVCEEEGISCSIYPDDSGDTIIFYHWEGIESIAESIIEKRPDSDILFGQDLCHQVPAVVRWRRKGKRV